MWAREIRSLAPRILAYDAALGTTAAPITAADPARNILRSIFPSDLLIVLLRLSSSLRMIIANSTGAAPTAHQDPGRETTPRQYPTRVIWNVNRLPDRITSWQFLFF